MCLLTGEYDWRLEVYVRMLAYVCSDTCAAWIFQAVCVEVSMKCHCLYCQHLLPTLPLEPLPRLARSAYDDTMLLIELAILDVLLILTAFVCFTYVSNRNARVGAGAGILALGIAVTTTFPFFPVIGIGIAVSLIGLWILSLRLPQARTTADTETAEVTSEVTSNVPNDDPSQPDIASQDIASPNDVSQSTQNNVPSGVEQNNNSNDSAHDIEHHDIEHNVEHNKISH